MIKIELDRIHTVKQLRHLLNMTQEQFSKAYSIPKRTIENWEVGKSKCPSYVLSLLRLAVLNNYSQLSELDQEVNFIMAVQQREHKDIQDVIDDRFA